MCILSTMMKDIETQGITSASAFRARSSAALTTAFWKVESSFAKAVLASPPAEFGAAFFVWLANTSDAAQAPAA